MRSALFLAKTEDLYSRRDYIVLRIRVEDLGHFLLLVDKPRLGYRRYPNQDIIVVGRKFEGVRGEFKILY